MAPRRSPRYRTSRRSLSLFRSFLKEQSAPRVFYGSLAADTVIMVTAHEPVRGRTVLDIGAGEPDFGAAFAAAGAEYAAIDVNAGVLDSIGQGKVRGDGLRLPIASDSVDVVLSSNLVEHVRHPGVLGREMIRVARPGGLVVISHTAWWSPWGGHETSPWHYLGGRYAARRYERNHGRAPKNAFGSTMFKAHLGATVDWARAQPDAWLIEAVPRYHPDWAGWVVRVPVLRELLTWNVLVVMRKKP